MFVRRFVVAVVAAFLTVGAMPVVPAYAESVWTPPEPLGTGYEPTLAGNGRGDAVAAWTTRDGLQVSVRPRGGVWSRPEAVPGSLGANGANVVVDGQGNVAVAFLTDGACEFDVSPGTNLEEDYKVHVAYRTAGGTWRVKTMDGTMRGCESNTPVLAVDGAGTVTAAWHADGIRVAQRPIDGAWTKPVGLGGGLWPSVVGGLDGIFTIVWHSQGKVVASSGSRSTWTAPVVIGESDRPYGAVQLARDGQGILVAAWTLRDEVASATKPARGEWLPSETLPQPTQDTSARVYISDVHVAVAEQTHTITWTLDRDASQVGHDLVATTRPAGGSWGKPAVLSNDADFRFATAGNAAGTMVVYTTVRDAGGVPQAVHRPVGGDWSGPTALAPADDPSRGSWTVEVLGLSSGMFTAVHAQGKAIMFRDFVDDSRAPSARVVTPLGPVTLSGKVRVSWSARDDLSGVRDVDLRLRSAGRRGDFSDWSRSLSRSTATSVVRRVDPGQTACYSVRARDRVGNQGVWGKDRCVTAPVDERAATASPGWAMLRSKASYRGTLMSTDRRGSRLTLGGVTARRIGLVARTCSGCGKVAVIHGGRRVATFELGSRKTRNKRVRLARAYPGPRPGKVVVRVVSSGKPVHIDGIVAMR